MNVLMVARYGVLAASSRMRCDQYQPRQEAAGMRVITARFFSDADAHDLQQNTTNLTKLVHAYTGRIRSLLSSQQFDLLCIETETSPWLPAWFEEMLLPSSLPYVLVLDYDDAVFHYYDQHRNPILKTLLAGKHPALIRNAALVIAGNEYLAEFAWRAGAKHVEIVSTAIDLQRYPMAAVRQATRDTTLPCVGWIGQRATASFLAPHKRLFEPLPAAGSARFAAIDIDAQSLGPPKESIARTEATEADALTRFSIGNMPLADEPFEYGVNGFLAEPPVQREQEPRILLADARMSQRRGQAGRQKVELQYCMQATGPRLVKLLTDVARV